MCTSEYCLLLRINIINLHIIGVFSDMGVRAYLCHELRNLGGPLVRMKLLNSRKTVNIYMQVEERVDVVEQCNVVGYFFIFFNSF